jgi:hypothetical protein
MYMLLEFFLCIPIYCGIAPISVLMATPRRPGARAKLVALLAIPA